MYRSGRCFVKNFVSVFSRCLTLPLYRGLFYQVCDRHTDFYPVVCVLAVIYYNEAVFLVAEILVGVYYHFVLAPAPGKILDLQLVAGVSEDHIIVSVQSDIPGFFTLEIQVLYNKYTATVTVMAPPHEHRADKIIFSHLMLQVVQDEQAGGHAVHLIHQVVEAGHKHVHQALFLHLIV